MKYLLFLILICLSLSGCSNQKILTNDEIISECKKCEEAGMNAWARWNTEFTGEVGIIKITCVPKEKL